MVCVKDSLLLLYLRISPCVRFRRWVNCFLALFTIDAIIWSLVAAFQCSPINRAWTWSESGHCRNREFLYKAQGLWNLVENVVIIILPIPTIMRLQMQKRRRLLLSAVFAVGLVYVMMTSLMVCNVKLIHVCRPCVAVVARLIPTTSPKVFQSDLTWWLITMQNWTAVEYGSGMICASLILLKPLIKIVFPSILGRSTLELRDRAAAPCPKQAKRAQCPKVACHQMNQQGCVTVPKKIGHALPEKALRIVTDQSRPLWYLDGLQSPDLEASYDNDTFSLASSQSPIDHNPCSIPSYGRRPLEINL